MSVDYYLVDKASRTLFQIGTHKHEFAAALRRVRSGAIGSEYFVDAVLSDDRHSPKSAEYNRWLTEQAQRIQAFAEAASWNVDLVNDCDDSLFVYNGCEVVLSVYDRFEPYRVDGGSTGV